MPIFYDNNKTTFELTEPQLTRWRHRYRGHRESLKVNTEGDQMKYDIHSLYAQLESLRERLMRNFHLLEQGGEVDALYSEDGGAEDSVVLSGLDSIAAEIEALRHRLQRQEI